MLALFGTAALPKANPTKSKVFRDDVWKYYFLIYHYALQITGLELLSLRRESQVCKLFNEIKCKGHVLNNLLPANNVDNCNYHLRDTYPEDA